MNSIALPSSPTRWTDDLLRRLCLRLQLSATQHAEAEQHYKAVGEWLGAPESALASWDPVIFPQGSLRIGTTVRPLGRDEFDLDLVCLLLAPDGADPVAVLELVAARLRSHGTLGPMVELKTRCVRVTYAKQFHLDVLPARPDCRMGGTCVLVPDRGVHDWKESNPKGYAAWFESRGALFEEMRKAAATIEPLPGQEPAGEKNSLQLAVQLVKRWRDIRYKQVPDFAPISIVLTTLCAEHYAGEPSPLAALEHIVEAVQGSLPPVGRLVVRNPANPLEDLSERWDSNAAAYRSFVDALRELRADLALLRQESGLDRVGSRLSKMFGAHLSEAVLREQAALVQDVRARKNLTVVTGSGAIATTASPATVRVRPNTFYGA